jgi:hypothetical protein
VSLPEMDSRNGGLKRSREEELVGAGNPVVVLEPHTVGELLGPLESRFNAVYTFQPSLEDPQPPLLRSGLCLVQESRIAPHVVRNDTQNVFLRAIYKRKAVEAALNRRKKAIPPAPVRPITDLIASASVPTSDAPSGGRVKPPMNHKRN